MLFSKVGYLPRNKCTHVTVQNNNFMYVFEKMRLDDELYVKVTEYDFDETENNKFQSEITGRTFKSVYKKELVLLCLRGMGV